MSASLAFSSAGGSFPPKAIAVGSPLAVAVTSEVVEVPVVVELVLAQETRAAANASSTANRVIVRITGSFYDRARRICQATSRNGDQRMNAVQMAFHPFT